MRGLGFALAAKARTQLALPFAFCLDNDWLARQSTLLYRTEQHASMDNGFGRFPRLECCASNGHGHTPNYRSGTVEVLQSARGAGTGDGQRDRHGLLRRLLLLLLVLVLLPLVIVVKQSHVTESSLGESINVLVRDVPEVGNDGRALSASIETKGERSGIISWFSFLAVVQLAGSRHHLRASLHVRPRSARLFELALLLHVT